QQQQQQQQQQQHQQHQQQQQQQQQQQHQQQQHQHQHQQEQQAQAQAQAQVVQQQQQQQQQPPPPPPPPQVSQPQQERPQPPTLTVPSPPQNDFQSPPLPQPKPLHASARHSIFTPIDDSQSMLAAHWGSSSTSNNNANAPRGEIPFIKQENRSQSLDVAAMSRSQPNGEPKPQPQPSPLSMQQVPQRTQSTSSMPAIPPPTRTNSLRMGESKPRLRVQIPSEHSDAGSATADSSPKDSGTTGATPGRSTDASHSSGVVLPPPSPSANSLLSAGATGPPNPFARPPPPSNSNSYGSRNDMETPISALPSRFVENGLLPSPSSFYPEWGFGRDSNMLPSPLTFQTPVAPNGPSFARDDSADRKRKTSDQGSDDGSQKRVKT
ncbi:hypothetical protein PTT_14716, partial [Pyrenophora teres f. teres 0-1]